LTENSDKKQKPHLFKPGQSGNPKGKPKGARSKAVVLLESMVDGKAQELMKTALELALGGDRQVLMALINKVLPDVKDKPVSVSLPAMKGAQDLPKLTAAIMGAVGDGRITPMEAAALCRITESHCKAFEIQEIESRLSAIETKFKENTK
jgi:hypothetical protein